VAAEALTHRLSACPDAETLAAYLDGRLDRGERERVTAHAADCDACCFVVMEVAQVPSTVAPTIEPAPVSAGRGWWASKPVVWSSSIAGALATAAMVWFAVGGGWLASSSDSATLQALVAAVGNERTVEARLTGGFAYGPLRGAVRSGELSAVPVSPDVRIAAARIEKETLGRRTPEALRLLGLAHLVTGDVARAVPVLEEAVNRPSPDPKALSDLAAAYLVRAARGNQPQDLAKALAAADRAVKADSSLIEAWFNRAYALDRLSLGAEARDAWEEYLRLDEQSAWADEARQHLQRLR
jgi:tetratricopeptide (TPR) repeat protein